MTADEDGVNAERRYWRDRLMALEGEVHAQLRERFLGQAETIEDWGNRLDRIVERHSVAYDSTMEEVHGINAKCDHCRRSYPCPDRIDADRMLGD